MTQPLDPYTLRQAAARWPHETLSPRAAQSFLRSLAEESEWLTGRQQPATAVICRHDGRPPHEWQPGAGCPERPATVVTFMGEPLTLQSLSVCGICWAVVPAMALDLKWHEKAAHS